ncbi:MAG: hypothetical protein ACKOAL_08025, partial [Chthoniobacterales bacterium]
MSHPLLSAGDASSAARRWRDAARTGKQAVAGGVAAPAQPFLVAWLAKELGRPICVVCPDVKHQEEFFHDLRFWDDRALLVPDLELSAPGAVTDPELAAARLGALHELRGADRPVVVFTVDGLDHAAPSPAQLQSETKTLRRGEALAPQDLVAELERTGFVRVAMAAVRGQYAVRGGIVDVFPWQTALPVRLEFFGDELESLRSYDPDSQRSVETMESCEICLGAAEGKDSGTARDYLPAK